MFQTCVSQKMEQIYFYLFLPLLLLLLSHFSCVRLCNPIPGILQARTLEWVAISFCNAWKWKVKVKLLSWVWLLVTPWTGPPARLLCPWDFPGKSTGVGCHCLLRFLLLGTAKTVRHCMWNRYLMTYRLGIVGPKRQHGGEISGFSFASSTPALDLKKSAS